MRNKQFIIVLLVVLWCGGCGAVNSAMDNVTNMVGIDKKVTVLTKAQIRTSYSVVASDLLEVKRGDVLDILDETDFEKVHWYRVRAHDEDQTEGWIEAQNVIPDEVLDKSKKLAEEDKDLQAQATGQLRAASNLRLSPEQKDDNILFKLENGATFDIIAQRFVPKVQDASDVDNAKKGEQKQTKKKTKNEEIEAAKEKDEPAKLDETYDVWYKVRLDPSVSPAPSGWVFGRQVELKVPNDIAFYQISAKKFVTWQRLDNVDNGKPTGKDADKTGKPGSWVILARGNQVKAIDGVEPDFDTILVLGYDSYREEHYTAYRSGDVWGVLPMKMEGTGDNKTFVVKLRNAAGQLEEKRFVTFKDASRHIKVTVPDGITKPAK